MNLLVLHRNPASYNGKFSMVPDLNLKMLTQRPLDCEGKCSCSNLGSDTRVSPPPSIYSTVGWELVAVYTCLLGKAQLSQQKATIPF